MREEGNGREQEAAWEPESDNNSHTALCLLSAVTQWKGTQVALHEYTVTERSISLGKITIIELFQQTPSSSPPHSVQTLEPKANRGNADSGCLWKLSPESPKEQSETSLYNRHISTIASQMSFKSSLTLTTSKERKEAWWYYLNLHFYAVKKWW